MIVLEKSSGGLTSEVETVTVLGFSKNLAEVIRYFILALFPQNEENFIETKHPS